jgi:putative PEP-CTERM system histidine kinase
VSIGVLGYSFTALLLFFLGILLLTSWRGRIEGAYLVTAVLITCLWAVSSVFLLLKEEPLTIIAYHVLEIGRNVAWFVFLFRLLKALREAGGNDGGLLRYAPIIVLIITIPLFIMGILAGTVTLNLPWAGMASMQLLGHLGLAITGLTLIEQLFRNTRPEKRWAVKYLYFGIGSLFAYDFFLYSDALLFRQVDGALWEARGFISAMLVPLVAVAAARNPSWSVTIFVSRRVVFHTTTLLGAGIYLLVMSAVGYYIRLYGGTWGKAAQVIFLFMAVVLLIALLFSGNLRSKLKVFLSKHFFNYKYDYRDEWLRIIHTLSNGEPGPQIRERVIKAIADLVDSVGGVLWMQDEKANFVTVSAWHAALSEEVIDPDSSLIRFFKDKDWIVDIQELNESPGLYDDLELPSSLNELDLVWLLVPVKHHSKLIGFIVLKRSLSPRQINWEDRDLLKTAAQQAASYLALMNASEALARANQFEAFNRLSAFVVHDLKNLLAQLELLVKNAERHKNNPMFMDDAINTVDNAAKKMSRLLSQLRKGRFEKSPSKLFSLREVLQRAVDEHRAYQPAPLLETCADDLHIVADQDRFTAVIGHMIKNAQEAVVDDGYIKVRLKRNGKMAEIDIEDNGIGMDNDFIRNRLFQPFETTKGNAGMGVGVYESREFIRGLGGDIEVLSEINKGTTFILKIPVREQIADPKSHDIEQGVGVEF